MDAQTAYQRTCPTACQEAADLNAYRSERLGQYDAGLRLRAAAWMRKRPAQRQIPGKLWLNQSDLTREVG